MSNRNQGMSTRTQNPGTSNQIRETTEARQPAGHRFPGNTARRQAGRRSGTRAGFRRLSNVRAKQEREASRETGGSHSATIEEVYARFYEYTFGENAARRLSASTAENTRKVYFKLTSIHDRHLDDLTIDELQQLINDLPLGRTMVSKTRLLIRRLYTYALPRGMCRTNPAQYLIMPDRPDHRHFQDFNDEELQILWRNRRDPIVRMLLIMCYSGFRISAYETLETDLQQGFFRGGVKTPAGKGRIVPIHSAVLPLVQEALEEEGAYLCGLSKNHFNHRMHEIVTEIGIDVGDRYHTPHSCRHTFSRLCESYGVREADRKRMLGHSFADDITNGVYGHRTLEELRSEIEKIQVKKF